VVKARLDVIADDRVAGPVHPWRRVHRPPRCGVGHRLQRAIGGIRPGLEW